MFAKRLTPFPTWLVASMPKRGVSQLNTDLINVEDHLDDKQGLHVRRIVMVNKKQRNTMSLEMIKNLQHAVLSTPVDKCRALVISSSCPKVFSSGHNLKELTTEKGEEMHTAVFRECTKLCMSLRELPIPTVAEVHGLAAAAGFQIAASCDLIVASNKASFSTPGVRFGLFCTTPGVALARSGIGAKQALRMLYTGEPMSSQQALTHGLISELVESDVLDEEASMQLLRKRVDDLLKKIESNSKWVIAHGKKAFYEQSEMNHLSDAYRVASAAMVDNLKYVDTQQGLKAFANKKKPSWSHSNEKI